MVTYASTGSDGSLTSDNMHQEEGAGTERSDGVGLRVKRTTPDRKQTTITRG